MGKNLKSMFSAMKNEGYVIKPLELYLMKTREDQDRRIDINAPSQAGTCMRSRYYARTGVEQDAGAIEPRARRIFDNGHHVHERLQEYLMSEGILKMSEIPVHDLDYNIQGHTDGMLDLGNEYAVLEIKSINSKGFADLKDAKPDHKQQGLVYLHCLEKHRRHLRFRYRTQSTFGMSLGARKAKYAEMYQHLENGSKHTREEKIKYQVKLHTELDKILWRCSEPLTKVIFLYENKDTQELKEYVLDSTDNDSIEIIEDILGDYATLNEAVDLGYIPERISANKSDYACRWCNFRNTCHIV